MDLHIKCPAKIRRTRLPKHFTKLNTWSWGYIAMHNRQAHFSTRPMPLMKFKTSGLDRKAFAFDLLMRVAAVSALSIFAIRILQIELRAPSFVLTTLFISEALVVALAIFSKATHTRVLTTSTVISTLAGSFYFLLIQLDNGVQLVPMWCSEAIMIVGLIIQITAKLYIGRNFGLLPAVRGIVTRGPYKAVRHPIYFGYFVTHLGFLSNVFSWQNILILTLLYIFQFIRIIKEEAALSTSEEYRTYMNRVTKRFIPFIV